MPMKEPMIESPLARLTPEQIEEIGREFDAIHDEVFNSLGERDARYIRSIIALHRQLALLSRAILLGSRYKPAWLLGTSVLGIAKILENMEIGHNVMHGQWDWMNDPKINSANWDWDSASTPEAWKHSHNYVHHTFTNIRGKDIDLGYEIMRIDPHQPWHPVYLAQPFYNVLLAAFFEWGVAFHDLDLEALKKGEKSKEQLLKELKGMGGKAWRQILKDYIAFPLLSGPGGFKQTLTANFTANLIRNFWAYAIIFCGHFPDQCYTFSQEETENETRGGFYVRQLLGAANIEGSPVFHVMAGNLGYQVEHHIFPDMPSSRYAQIAPKVKDICERYGLPYNSGRLGKQFGTVQRTILRLAFPGGEPRPKPGAYRPEDAPVQGRPLIAV
ncbi:fatty acid desaturase family protein [Nocardioides stalactiti]|uniref:fatty acid desaturase family protein n=1 Tax=Nocardioides stalactiti TaxID=2755356 RepID=UPI0016029797|nr:acyl-CoA desaturase [Nocardioides stalactiti]